MTDPDPAQPLTLLPTQAAPAPPNGPPREAYRQWSSLMLILVILGVIVLTGMALIIVQRRGRRRKDRLPKRPSLPHVNAWEEAGRRFDGSITEFNDD